MLVLNIHYVKWMLINKPKPACESVSGYSSSQLSEVHLGSEGWGDKGRGRQGERLLVANSPCPLSPCPLVQKPSSKYFIQVKTAISKTVFTKVLTDEELNKLQMPTLFLVGENEIIYSARKAVERVQKAAPNIQTSVIKSAGHDLPFAQPIFARE